MKPIEHVLHENVFPWILENMINFLQEDDFVDINSDEIVRDAFQSSKAKHRESVENQYQRRQYIKDEEERQRQEKEAYRIQRRQMREQRRREELLQQLKNEIRTYFVEKAEVREHVL